MNCAQGQKKRLGDEPQHAVINTEFKTGCDVNNDVVTFRSDVDTAGQRLFAGGSHRSFRALVADKIVRFVEDLGVKVVAGVGGRDQSGHEVVLNDADPSAFGADRDGLVFDVIKAEFRETLLRRREGRPGKRIDHATK